jgi:hypothetical protein
MRVKKELKDFAKYHKEPGYQSRIFTVDYELPTVKAAPARKPPDCRVYRGLSLDVAIKTPPGELPEENLKEIIPDVFIGGGLRVRGKSEEIPRPCQSKYQNFVSRRFLNDLKNLKEA